MESLLIGTSERPEPTRYRVVVLTSCLLLLLLLNSSIPSAAQSKIETQFNAQKNQTTVRLAPIQIPIADSRYHSLHISPSFSYAGQTPARPDHIDFELQTVVKGRLRIDLYVVFVIDGETVFLSSNRWAVKNPVRGRRWVGERLVFRMPVETFFKMAQARSAAIKLDGVNFELQQAQLNALQEFAKVVPAK